MCDHRYFLPLSRQLKSPDRIKTILVNTYYCALFFPDTSEGSNGRHGYYSDDEDDDDTFFLGISHGAYAGIVCGILFVACVALLTALHYRKRWV